ncbi:MAG: hypothetical protein EPN14_01510 [Gallionella sp.]|nr:MAG: hypothetical protein EPN14_01510 [Gallionella sp.]
MRNVRRLLRPCSGYQFFEYKWLGKRRFIQAVRAELVEAHANMLIHIGGISASSMRTDLISVSLEYQVSILQN